MGHVNGEHEQPSVLVQREPGGPLILVLELDGQSFALTPAQAGDLGELLWEVAGLEERTNGSAGEFKVRLADGMFEVLTRHPDGFEPADPHGVRQVKRYG